MDKFRVTKSYKSGSFAFPKDDIDPKEKNATWGKDWLEAIYAAWIKDRTSIPYSQLEEMKELRNFGDGKQNIEPYKKILLDESEEDGALEGYMNLNFEIFSVAPKFLNVVVGMFEAQDHNIVATAIDPKSKEQKDLSKLRTWFRSQYKDELQQIESKLGAKPRKEFLPETKEELELYSQTGGLKLAKETEIEEGLQYTFYISDWAETKRKMIHDFLKINCAACKDFTDPYTRKVKTRYVDPLKYITQYSRHWDHRNSEYGAELIQVSISDLRKILEVDEDDLRNLAEFYNGRGLNPTISNWTDEMKTDAGGYKYDSFMVDVLDGEWFSVNKKFTTRRTNKYGETFSYTEKWGKVYDTELKKTKSSTYKTVYKGKWIVGTDYVYDFGQQYDIVRPGKKEVELSYKFYKLEGRSIVSLMVPNLNAIQLTWLKLQNAIAMASNPGIAVEYTTLMNMTLGGKKMEPLEILNIKRSTGDLIYKTTTHRGMPTVSGNTRPITELEGGLGRQLSEYISIFELNLNFIRDITGINQIADASNPNPEQSVKGSQLAIAATSNALRPIYSGYIRLKEQTARSCTIRLKMLIKHDKKAYEGYMPVVGAIGTKILSVGADTVDANYNIKIEAKPTEERKEAIKQAAMAAMQPDKDGYIGLDYSDWMMIERLLESGNLKYAEALINHRIKVNKERQQKIQERNMQLAEQNAQKTAQVKGQIEAEKENLKAQNKLKEIQLEKDLENRNAQLQHERDKELKAMELSIKAAELQSKNTVNEPAN